MSGYDADVLRISTSSPASTANLGSGFDCLALAFDDLRNKYELYADLRRLSENSVEFTFCDPFQGAYASADRRMRTVDGNLFVQAFENARRYLCNKAGRPVPRCPCFVTQRVDIPPVRGLGSSSSACVAGALAGLEFFRRVYPRIELPKLLQELRIVPVDDYQLSEITATLAMETDSCPDNVCAALVGGLTYCYSDRNPAYAQSIEGQLHFFRDTVDDESLRCIVLVPYTQVDTVEARKILDRQQYRLRDVVFNLQRVASFPRVLKDRRYELLKEVTQDRIHQVQRARELYIGDRGQHMNLEYVFNAAIDSGAYCAFISGAGSSLVAMSDLSTANRVAEGFRQAFLDVAKTGWKIERILTLKPTNAGATCHSDFVMRKSDDGHTTRLPQLQQWIDDLPPDAGPLNTRPKAPPGYAAFLSYNRQDRGDVTKLFAALEAYGLSIWMDEEGLTPGEAWSPRLQDAIEKSRCFVICVGQHGIGNFQRQEMENCLELAAREIRPVVPVLLPGGPAWEALPTSLRCYQGTNLHDGLSETAVRRLVKAIQAD